MSDAPTPPPEPAAVPQTFEAAAFADATGATATQMAELERYRTLLDTWNQRINLVGPSAMAVFWRRHAFDSAQLLALAPEARVWADIGAGGGLPGVVLAILLKDTPGGHVHLIESLGKRCVFLREAASELALPVTVHNARAEDVKLTGIDVVTARACAPLSRLFGYARPILRGKVRGLFLKGAAAEAELADARQSWNFEATLIPSRSDASGRIVSVERLARV
ncbi:MAG: 16S rRNA (guanine(527)-N(7))-methyltransferase RsmG [Caulobacterales bacterium 32-69-10]|nr:MAG: 16S rRNA (guanine(527)-N(7))-methyltransferase RsmG [Caulobacterales bacterium 32-69-10]